MKYSVYHIMCVNKAKKLQRWQEYRFPFLQKGKCMRVMGANSIRDSDSLFDHTCDMVGEQ